MSRRTKYPIKVASNVNVEISGQNVKVKGPLGQLERKMSKGVSAKHENEGIFVTFDKEQDPNGMFAGTERSLINNMVVGVSEGFVKELQMVGVGYRSKVSGKLLDISAGFSHPVNFTAPEGITIETPSQTDIVIKGIDKQLVGEVAAKIRSIRPPEPYKGKGIRYKNEVILMKEGKKK